jgi:predicted nucleotidyltransferase
LAPISSKEWYNLTDAGLKKGFLGRSVWLMDRTSIDREKLKLPPAAQKVLSRIMAGYHPQLIVLFGSYARGDVHEGSDLDLIIVKNTDERFIDRIEQVLAFSDGEMAVEPLVYTQAEIDAMLSEGNGFLETALREGIVVYEC